MSSELKENNIAAEAEENVTVTSAPDLEGVAAEAPVEDTRDFELRVSDAERAKKKKMKEMWDKVTTGLLLLLMSSPILILAYIFIWFLTK